jgi:hypothetical protein
MKKHFSFFLIIVALLVACFSFSSFASAATPKAVTYYTTQGTHLYKDKKGMKSILILPVNTKFYFLHKPAKGYYHVTYKKTSGYINVRNCFKSRLTSFKDFEGTWYSSGHKTISINANVQVVNKRGKLVRISMIDYNVADMAVAYVNARQITLKGNKLVIKNADLIGDGNSYNGKVNQTLTLYKGGKKLSVTNPGNEYIKSFDGIFTK